MSQAHAWYYHSCFCSTGPTATRSGGFKSGSRKLPQARTSKPSLVISSADYTASRSKSDSDTFPFRNSAKRLSQTYTLRAGIWESDSPPEAQYAGCGTSQSASQCQLGVAER